MDQSGSPTPPPNEPDRPARGADDSLALELTGDIKCIRCGYNQRGLSVRAPCPECGLPVLATILAVVDPQASELKPIKHRRIVAVGLLAWSIGALITAIATWLLRLLELVATPAAASLMALAAWVGIAGLVASGLGAAVLIHPHEGIPRARRMVAAIGVALYAPLMLTYWQIELVLDSTLPTGHFSLSGISPSREALRLMFGALAVGIVFCLRVNARLLAARSLVVRSGRVDRQSMLALAAALGIASAGDALFLIAAAPVGAVRDVLVVAGTFAVGVGSLLLTVGIVGIVGDCRRLAPVILQPAPSPAEAMGTPVEPPHDRR